MRQKEGMINTARRRAPLDSGLRRNDVKGECMQRIQWLLCFLFLLLISSVDAHAQEAQESIALHGTPKYAPGFQHFDYVNPDAPKGGELHLASIGTFDTLNPYTLKGVTADNAGVVFET